MKHTLNRLRELKWFFCNKQKIKPIHEKLKSSFTPNTTLPNHKLTCDTFVSLHPTNNDVINCNKLFYMCSPNPTIK